MACYGILGDSLERGRKHRALVRACHQQSRRCNSCKVYFCLSQGYARKLAQCSGQEAEPAAFGFFLLFVTCSFSLPIASVPRDHVPCMQNVAGSISGISHYNSSRNRFRLWPVLGEEAFNPSQYYFSPGAVCPLGKAYREPSNLMCQWGEGASADDNSPLSLNLPFPHQCSLYATQMEAQLSWMSPPVIQRCCHAGADPLECPLTD